MKKLIILILVSFIMFAFGLELTSAWFFLSQFNILIIYGIFLIILSKKNDPSNSFKYYRYGSLKRYYLSSLKEVFIFAIWCFLITAIPYYVGNVFNSAENTMPYFIFLGYSFFTIINMNIFGAIYVLLKVTFGKLISMILMWALVFVSAIFIFNLPFVFVVSFYSLEIKYIIIAYILSLCLILLLAILNKKKDVYI